MEMIVASSKHASSKCMTEKHFLYDIVANGRNGIDVDKFDYIVRDSRACDLGCNFQFQRLMETMRVVDDEICYRAKDHLTIHKLFASRADLHRTVYTHAKVKAVELMFVDALLKASDYLNILSYVHEPAEYWKLDDSILKRIETSSEQELKESRDLILRIRRRDLYQFCNEFSVPKDKLDHFRGITPQDIVCSQKTGGVTLREDVAVSNVRIDLTRGWNNPLEMYLRKIQLIIMIEALFVFSQLFDGFANASLIYQCLVLICACVPSSSVKFFQDYESDEKFFIPDDQSSHLLPAFYQDMIVRVYSKKPELVEAVSVAFENFQIKTYGMKVQVHSTPEKKKYRK